MCMSAVDALLTVDGVECKRQKGGMLTVGINVPKPLRFPVKQKADDNATRESVRKHPKFAAAMAALMLADSGSLSSAPPPSQPLQREVRGLASDLPFRQLPTMPEPKPLARVHDCEEQESCKRSRKVQGTANAAHTIAGSVSDGRAVADTTTSDPPPPPLPWMSCHFCKRFSEERCCGLHRCAICGQHLCDVSCSRRQVACPHAANEGETLNGISVEHWFRVYAEVAAGIGCKCSCCLAFAEYAVLAWEDQLHVSDGPPSAPYIGTTEAVASETRKRLRNALAAAGNPRCWLGHVLERAEACTGSCGLHLEQWAECCGIEEIEAVLQKLVEDTVAAQKGAIT